MGKICLALVSTKKTNKKEKQNKNEKVSSKQFAL